MSSSHHQRRTILYSGRVQGVGFRYTMRSIAGAHPVTGYVRNLPDGRVELVVEGGSDSIDSFLSEVRDRLQGQIRDEKADIQPATGEFRAFDIRH